MAKIEQGLGVVHCQGLSALPGAGGASARASGARRRSRPPLAGGSAVALPEPDRADPAGRGRRGRSLDGGLGALLGRRHHAAGAAPRSMLTVVASLIVAAVNVVMGTLIAWVLVRDDFRGKRVVDTLIDLPFALPTIVAGLVLLALYGPSSPVGVNLAYTRVGVVLALLFVTLPFVVRTVQPVLLELDREMEEAAASLGAEPLHDLPPDRAARTCCRRSSPAPASAFARAISEFGSRRADLRQPAVQDPGRLGAHLRPDRERQRAPAPPRCPSCCW